MDLDRNRRKDDYSIEHCRRYSQPKLSSIGYWRIGID
jgi:hypothetical protein